MTDPELYLGMICGSRRAGADAALVRFAGGRPELIQALCLPYTASLADDLACERLAPRPQDTRGITGVRKPVLPGEISGPPAV